MRAGRASVSFAIGALSLTLCAAAAPASDDDPGPGAPATSGRDVEILVVTASREPRPLPELPGGVDVIPGEDIEAGHYDGVLELLRHRAGLHADQPGARGSRASVYTRGLDPNHTLVLLDGVVVNDPTNARGGSFDFSTLDAGGIDRIEIVRGPYSAVHGSDALAGAIHVVTRSGEGPDQVDVDLSCGRWAYCRAAGRVAGERGPFDLALMGSYVDEGRPADVGDYRGGTLHARLGLDLPAGLRASGTLRFGDSRAEAFPEFSGGKELAVIRELEQREIREITGSLSLTQRPLEWLDWELGGSVYRRREDLDSPGVAPSAGDPFGVPAQPDTRDRLHRDRIGLRATGRASYGFSLSAGGEVYRERGRSRGTLVSPLFTGESRFDLERVVGSSFAEVHWRCDCGLAALAGLRVEYPEDASAEPMPRVSVSYALPWSPVRLMGSWGEGFKLPSFFALGNPVAGNPDLVPERSRGWDAGVSAAAWGGRIEAQIRYFDVRVRNLIDFDPLAFRLENLRRVRSRGIEAEARVAPIEALELSGHLTYADTFEEHTRSRLRNRPRWRGGVTVAWSPVERFQASLRMLFVSSVLDGSVPTAPEIVKLDPYGRLDLALSWSPREWAEVYLAIDNLLDEDYQEAVGFPAVGIRPRAGVRLRR